MAGRWAHEPRPGISAPDTFAAMDARFAHLMAPGRIGTLEIRNRILMCPMGDGLAETDGQVSERQVAYYEARARGGAGMLLVGSASVAYPSGSYGASQTALSRDDFLPGLRRLTARVRHHGARISAQLVHDGQRSLLDIAQGRAVLCASPPTRSVPDRLSRMVTTEEITAMTAPFTQPTSKFAAHVATDDDLAGVVAAFADATDRAARAGFDGVEVHAGHGYLIDDFLSPASNRRTDQWGGSVEHRARLLCEVVRAARASVGPDFPIWFRINALERFRDGGETFADTLEVIDLAIAAGADAVHVSAFADGNVAVGITRSHTPHEPNALVEFAAEVKQRVRVPVIMFGRIEPDDAERTRAPKRVLVIGGGPAGMDAARRLAETGHDVELWEATARLGGRLAAAARCDEPLDRFLGWLLRALEQSGATISVGAPATPARVAAGRFDEVVVATGARWTAPELPGADQPFVMTVDAIDPWLSGADVRLGSSIVIVGGGKVGLSLADLAARRGLEVTVLEATSVFGRELGLPGRFEMVADLEARGVTLCAEVAAQSFEPGRVIARGADGEVRHIEADAAIIATPSGRDDRMGAALRGAGIAFRSIGDCRHFGLLEGALLDASTVVSALVDAR